MKNALTLGVAAIAMIAAAPAFAAGNTASDTATSSATVIKPITIADSANLSFGTFAPDGTARNIVVTQAGVRTAPGDTLIASSAGATAAKFDVTGEASRAFDISVSENDLTSGTDTMALSLSAPPTGTLDTAGAASFNVGGTMALGAAQAPGSYTGTITATVTYQ